MQNRSNKRYEKGEIEMLSLICEYDKKRKIRVGKLGCYLRDKKVPNRITTKK